MENEFPDDVYVISCCRPGVYKICMYCSRTYLQQSVIFCAQTVIGVCSSNVLSCFLNSFMNCTSNRPPFLWHLVNSSKRLVLIQISQKTRLFLSHHPPLKCMRNQQRAFWGAKPYSTCVFLSYVPVDDLLLWASFHHFKALDLSFKSLHTTASLLRV